MKKTIRVVITTGLVLILSMGTGLQVYAKKSSSEKEISIEAEAMAAVPLAEEETVEECTDPECEVKESSDEVQEKETLSESSDETQSEDEPKADTKVKSDDDAKGKTDDEAKVDTKEQSVDDDKSKSEDKEKENSEKTSEASEAAETMDCKSEECEALQFANLSEADMTSLDLAPGGEDAESKEASEEKPETEPEKVKEVEEETADSLLKNAIQTQIEDAIKGMDSEGDCIIKVEDGTYDGNITINKKIENIEKLANKTLYILADGAYETKEGTDEVDKTKISTGASGNAKVNGDINIDGIKVVLAGIYFSLGHKIAVNESETKIYGTDQDDNINVEVQKNAKVEVYGGDGSDTITVTGSTPASNDSSDESSATGSREVTLDGGAGSDVYEVDLSVGGDEKNKSDTDTTKEKETTVTINGDEEDRLHLSGKLDSSKIDTTKYSSNQNPDDRKTYVQNSATSEHKINLISSDSLRTKITIKNCKDFTDELENKKTVNIVANDLNNGVLKSGKITNKTFTNYVYAPGDTAAITISKADADLATTSSFSQLVIGKAGKNVKVGKVKTNGMNLMVVGKTININKTVNTGNTGNLVVRASDSDKVNVDLTGLIPESIKDYVPNDVTSNLKLSVFSIKSTATVNVNAKGNIKAKNVDLKAESKQNQPLVPFEKLKGANFATLKIGKALVNVKGKITAAGALLGRAVSAIVASADNDTLSKWYIPIAAGVLLGEAGVIVTGSANVIAQAIKLLSDSSVKLNVSSTVGTIPISMAVAAIDNDSKVEISKKAVVESKKGNTTLDASGTILVNTKSHARNKETKDDAKNKKDNTKDKKETDKSGNLYGGFLSVSVAVQDVIAQIIGNAKVVADKADVCVRSEALESVLTTAISSVPETTPKKDGKADSDNGKVASDKEAKSDKKGDNSDERSVENTKENTSNILEAAKNTKSDAQIGDKLDDKDTKKLETLQDKITGTDDGKESGIDKKFDEATKAADVAKDAGKATGSNSKTQLAGAIAVNVIINICKSLISTKGSVEATKGTVLLDSHAMTSSKTIANASQVKSAKKEGEESQKVNALGAAVSVNVVKHNNIAQITKGTVKAKELKVIATSGQSGLPVSVHTEAVAGISDSDSYGIAGAVAVDIANITTKAVIAKDAVISTSKGNIALNAVSFQNIKTIATTNVKVSGENNKTGVGVAISTAVNGIDTISSIGSSSKQTKISSDTASVSVKADNKLSEEVTATAGTIGKTGVSPALAIDISGVNAESFTYFKPAKGTIVMSGDFTMNANSKADRTISADASAESSSAAGAGTLIFSLINDSATATSKSNLKANNIKINAVSKSILSKARARASSTGAHKDKAASSKDSEKASGDGDGKCDQDKQADEATDSAKELAKEVNTKNIKTDKITELTKNRQKAETSEGTLSVAAAFVLNIHNNTSIARILGKAIEATKEIAVTTTNQTSAYVLADASAVSAHSGSDGKVKAGDSVGVGAAAALNLINIVEKAYISTTADLKAGTITVKTEVAQTTKKTKEGDTEVETKEDDPNAIKTYAVSGAGAAGVGVAGSIAIARVDGEVDAYIVCTDNGQYKLVTSSEGDITVAARILNNEETIASASLKKNDPKKKDDDKPDKNEEGEKEKEAVKDSEKTKGDDGKDKTDDGAKIVEVNDDDGDQGGKKDTSETENEEPKKDDNNNAKNPTAKEGENATAVGVGASFAFDYSTIKTIAYIEAKKITSAKDLSITAEEKLTRTMIAVAGTDPVSKGAEAKTAVDAAVALLIEKDQVNVYGNDKTEIVTKGNVTLEAKHAGKTRAQSSGFAVGKQSAVGASVAFIWSGSDVDTTFKGKITSDGTVSIKAETKDEDRSLALATAMGTTQDKAKADSSDQPGKDNKNNKTASLINTTLNENKDKDAEGDASNEKSLSNNILKTQNIKTESTDDKSETGKIVKEAEKTANDQATNKQESGAGNNDITGDKKGSSEKKVDVAAAIGVNIAVHNATATVSGNITTSGQAVTIAAKNDAAFSALGTGITMTQMPATAAIAIGAALAYNKGSAVVVISDNTKINAIKDEAKDTEARGDITITADMSQNSDNDYFGAQAVSGSISKKVGTDSTKVAGAGAVAVLITDATTQISAGKNIGIKGADIKFSSTDDYKLYVRAGSISYQKKANVGLGLSFAMLYANDVIHTIIGNNASFDGNSLVVEAVKKHEDLLSGSGLLGYIAKGVNVYEGLSSNKIVSSSGDGSNREVKVDNASYKSIYTAQEAFNIINIFISDNYHIESFSGSYAAGEGKFNGAGAISFVLLNTDVRAQIGKNAVINIIKPKPDTENSGEDPIPSAKGFTLRASDNADTGLYTIGVSVGTAKNSAGASIAVMIDHSKAKALLHSGANVTIAENGGFKVEAETIQHSLIVSTAAAIAAGQSNTEVAGNLNVFYTDRETLAKIYENCKIVASENVDVIATFDNNTILIAAGVQGGKGTAAGGTLVVGIYGSDTEAIVGKEMAGTVTLQSKKGNVSVKADSKEKAISVLASASASISDKAGVAAVVDVLVSKAKSYAKVQSAATIKADKGDIIILATSDSMLIAVDVSAAIAFKGVAAGGLIQVSLFNRDVQSYVAKGSNLTAGGNALISAYALDRFIDILAAAEAGKNAFGGIIAVSVENTNISALLDSDSANKSSMSAEGSAGISAFLDSDELMIAGGANISGNVAAGGAISTVILNNTIEAAAADYASVLSNGVKALVLPSVTSGSSDRKRKVRGVAIDAGEKSAFKLISVSAGASGKVAVTGVINTVVSSSKVHATARGHNTLVAKDKSSSSSDDSSVPLAVEIIAGSKEDIVDAAGSLSASGKVGVGVSVVTFVYSADVESSAQNIKNINSAGIVVVDAAKEDSLFLIAVSIAASGRASVGVAPNVLVYRNKVAAFITGEGLTAQAKDNLKITSSAKADVNLLAAVVSGSGNVAVSVEGNVIYYSNDSKAYAGKGVKLKSTKGLILISSDTAETLNGGAVGIAGSGTAAVGGSADVVITNVSSQAYTEDKVTLTAETGISVLAKDEYGFVAIAGTIAGSGTAGIGVSAIVSVSHNNIKAFIGKNNKLTSGKTIDISAKSDRNIMTFAASIGASGTAGVGAGVVVIVAGSGIDKDSYDAIYTNGKIHPEDIVDTAYGKADKRAGEAFKQKDLREEVNTSITPSRTSALDVGNKGANGGNYADYGNGNGNVSAELVEQTSGNLSGRIKDLTDMTLSSIGYGSSLNAGGDVNVTSNENVSALVVAGGAGAGGTAGVGAGVAVVIVNSNVSALVDNKAVITTPGEITIEAKLTHDKKSWDISTLKWKNGGMESSAQDTIAKASANEKESKGSSTSTSDFGMLVISAAAAGGLVGVAPNVAYYNNSADVRALVKGSLNSKNSGKNANIKASTDFGNVGVFTVSIGAGAVGVAASVSLATNEAIVVAAFDPGMFDSQSTLSTLNVTADNKANLTSVNGVLAAGAVAVSVMVSIANNKLESTAYIGEYAKINADVINVNSNIEENIGAYFANIAAGAVAAGVTVAIANNKAVNNAYVGGNSYSPKNAFIKTKDISITGTVNGDVTALGASLTAGAIAANGAVVLALQNAQNNVTLKSIETAATNLVSLRSGMNGQAKTVVASVSAGAVGVGAVVAVSYIDSENIAKISSKDAPIKAKNIRIEAGGLTSGSDYDSSAFTTAATGGIGARGAAINFAFALNNAKNEAILETSGKVEAEEGIAIIAKGKNKAFAVAASGAVGAAAGNASYVYASLEGENKALLTAGEASDVIAKSLEIISQGNDVNTKPSPVTIKVLGKTVYITPDAAADARIYAGTVGAAAVTANKATAKADMTVIASAEFSGNSVSLGSKSDDISVRANGTSTANAKSLECMFSLANLGVVETKADAAGTFKAIWVNKASESNIIARNISVINEFATVAVSDLDPSALGVKITGVGRETNKSDAIASSIAETNVTGDLGRAYDTIAIKSIGSKVSANAHIKGTKVDVSGVKLAGSYVSSLVNVDNKVLVDSLGKVIRSKDIYVIAKLDDVSAIAKGGASTGKYSISLVGGGITEIAAKADVKNDACINNTKIIATGRVSLNSDVSNLNTTTGQMGGKAVHVEATADAPNYSIGVASAQYVSTKTDSVSTITARVTGNSNIIGAQIDVIAADNTEVSSKGSAPQVSITLASGDSVSVVTQAAKERERLVSTEIGSGVKLTTIGTHSSDELETLKKTNPMIDNITVRALADLSVATHLNSMSGYSGIKLGSYYFATDVGTTRTTVKIAGLLTSNNDVEILAKDNISSIVDHLAAMNAGLVSGGTSKVSGSVASQNAEVILGDEKAVKSDSISTPLGSIDIRAITTGNMSTSIESSAYGLGSKSNLEATNSFNRNTSVKVNDNYNMLAGGNISIYADAKDVTITSTAKGSAGGAVQKAIPKAAITYTENTRIDIGGCEITAQLGKVSIIAQTASNLSSKAEYTMTGGIESNRPSAEVTSTVNVLVNIAPDSAKTCSIYGADVEIAAYIDKQSHKADSKALTRSFATYTEATSKVTSTNNLLVNIGNASVAGYETLYIYCIAKTLDENAISFASIKGVTGKVYGNSDVSGGTYGNINIGNTAYKAILMGPDIVIRNGFADGFNSNNAVKRDATADGDTIVSKVTRTIEKVEEVVEKITSWLPWPLKNLVRWVTKKVTKLVTEVINVVTYSDAQVSRTGYYGIDGNVSVNLDLYCSEFAAGINILIGKDKKATVTGIKQQDKDKFITIDSDKITVHDIVETRRGEFTISSFNGKASGVVKAYTSSYIPMLNIDNYSDLPLYIKKVFLVGDTDKSHDLPMYIKAPAGIAFIYGTDSNSQVEINSYGKGDVIFTSGEGDSTGRRRYDDFDAGEGSITIVMNGGNVYTDGDAFVAANKITIEGASNVGNTVNGRSFNAYLFDVAPVNNNVIQKQGKSAAVSIKANDNVNLDITPVMIVYNSFYELARVANIFINKLESDVVNLKVNSQLYTLMVKAGNGTGKGTYSIREYLSYSNMYTAYLWVDKIKARIANIAASTPRGNSMYLFLVNSKGYDVGTLNKFKESDKLQWRVYTPVDPEEEGNPHDNGDEGNPEPRRWQEYQEEYEGEVVTAAKSAEFANLRKSILEAEKTLKKDDAKPRTTLRHLSKELHNKINRNEEDTQEEAEVSDTLLRQFGLTTDMDSNISNLYDTVMGIADYVKVVEKDGWNFVILASDVSIAAMKNAISNMITTSSENVQTESGISKSSANYGMFSGGVDAILQNEAVAKLVTGFNYSFVMLPIAILLIGFLVLTKKKKIN
ncbi:hypothetical protein [Butyrivibrio sp. YAB3001]|uniref:hypothetical protein n=1 Tax=Butyrivibrio sp. YAB3001 TaxID=1520812 RepID=UPI0008F668AE|nr:hypothetical protein [Butyrivibrio sp. YAB3001]SFB73189.1 hypothetical protein SAMN02910398_00494 [Butyrivibrio sp. YAB3001]